MSFEIVNGIICGVIGMTGLILFVLSLFSLWCCFKAGADSEKKKKTYFNITASKVDNKTKERFRDLRKQNNKNIDK